MRSKTMALFSVFMLVAIGASIFTYLYQQKADALIDRYIAQITTCGNITSETDCYAKDFCEGVYGPTCPDCPTMEFLRCTKVSPQLQTMIDQQQDRCVQTGGEWYRNKLGDFCLCGSAGLDMIFDPAKGCVAP